MNMTSDEFFKKLLETFKIEAAEHCQSITSGLLKLEKTAELEKQREIIEIIYRETHSLKGAARAVNLRSIESVCQSIENVFSALKRSSIVLTSSLFDLLHETIDVLDSYLSHAGEPEKEEILFPDKILQNLNRAAKSNLSPSPQTEVKKKEIETPLRIETKSEPSSSEPKSTLAETVRISTTLLGSLMVQVEEMIFARLAIARHATELREIHSTLYDWRKNWSKIHPEISALQRGLDKNNILESRDKRRFESILAFLEEHHDHSHILENQISSLSTAYEQDAYVLSCMLDTLLDDMKKTVMFPFHSFLEIFPKLIRDLCRDSGKEVDLEIQGGEIEIDRRILEEIKDPLIHMIRNCVDHGIEHPEERIRKNKSSRGKIQIFISAKTSNQVEICLTDDGMGIRSDKVKASAIKLGILSPEIAETLSSSEILALIFRSGVSTSPVITDLSGRGLGLAIVQEKVDDLGGTLSLESQPDKGTSIRLVLPMTLTTYRGIIVRVAEQLFVFPTAQVEHVIRLEAADIQTVENQETLSVDGQVISLLRLREILELSTRTDSLPSGPWPVLLIHSGQKRFAILVDEILQEQEILVKSLGPQLSRVRNIEGATILGTGSVVPILNVSDLIKTAIHSRSLASPASRMASSPESMRKKQSILVAEDSITARTLLKNILESSGYEVKTVVDGMDAFTQLRTAEFDLVVSDVDMPRMNGFELTAKIRNDKKLMELPVVLVTALQSREDREHGIDVGANAYIVKSSFDQSNLLEVIQRLI